MAKSSESALVDCDDEMLDEAADVQLSISASLASIFAVKACQRRQVEQGLLIGLGWQCPRHTLNPKDRLRCLVLLLYEGPTVTSAASKTSGLFQFCIMQLGFLSACDEGALPIRYSGDDRRWWCCV